jgi:hypothetical protein
MRHLSRREISVRKKKHVENEYGEISGDQNGSGTVILEALQEN